MIAFDVKNMCGEVFLISLNQILVGIELALYPSRPLFRIKNLNQK